MARAFLAPSASSCFRRIVATFPASVRALHVFENPSRGPHFDRDTGNLIRPSRFTFCPAARSPKAAPSTSTVRPMATSSSAENMDPTQQRLMFEDECILVDENDRVVGHDNKYNCHLMEKIESEKGGMLHRAFSVFLFDQDHKLLLQQRAASKVTFPLVWTNTCCSHPLFRAEEMEEQDFTGVKVAARRKLEDELGIPPEQVPIDSLECIGRIHYKAPSDGKWGEHELDYLVFMRGTVSIAPNPNEVASVRYVTDEELRDLVKRAEAGEEGVELSPWFKLVVDNFLYKWWDHLKEGTLDSVKDMQTIHRLL